MTQFEKDFVLKCLEFFENILINPEALEQAITDFSGSRTDDPRYHLNATIIDSELWIDNDKLKFSAAIFEATAKANYYFLTDLNLSQKVSLAGDYWKSNIVPSLSAGTTPEDRMSSIINNCTRKKIEVAKEVPSDIPQSLLNNNPYAFFTAVAAGLVVAAGVTIALTR